jgi:hypothetical protein
MRFDGLKSKLMNSMRGRNGIDPLYKAMMAVLIVLLVLNIFFPSPVLYLLSLLSGALAVFRGFSKNLAKRAEENRRYLALRDRIKKTVLQLRSRLRDRNTHRYRSCPVCKTTLRLVKKTGVNHVKCPVCKNEFDLMIRR